jgi:putative peptidoglycan lipid II flippase
MFLFFFRNELIDLLFLGGAFNVEDSVVTAGVFGFLTVGIIPGAIFRSLIRVYIIRKDTRTPFFLSIPLIVFNIVLNFILAIPFGVAGIALSTSITWCIQMILCYYLLCRQYGYFGLVKIKYVVVGIVGSIVVCYLSQYLCGFLDGSDDGGKFFVFVKLTIGVCIVGSLYYVICLMFDIDEIKALSRKVSRMVGYGKVQ